jgi:hypothetical protein
MEAPEEGELKEMTPAAVPGVINHRAGWWLRWDSITVSKIKTEPL